MGQASPLPPGDLVPMYRYIPYKPPSPQYRTYIPYIHIPDVSGISISFLLLYSTLPVKYGVGTVPVEVSQVGIVMDDIPVEYGSRNVIARTSVPEAPSSS